MRTTCDRRPSRNLNSPKTPGPKTQDHTAVRKKKRSFKEEREYKDLPDRIHALEEEQKQLQAALADPEFYKKPGAEIQAAVDRTGQIDRELHEAMHRWDELDSIS